MSDLSYVSKLTYRFDTAQMRACSLVARLLSPLPEPVIPPRRAAGDNPRPLVSLKVASHNLGDHIQIVYPPAVWLKGLRRHRRFTSIAIMKSVRRHVSRQDRRALSDCDQRMVQDQCRGMAAVPEARGSATLVFICCFNAPPLSRIWRWITTVPIHRSIYPRPVYPEYQEMGIDARSQPLSDLVLSEAEACPDMQAEVFVVSRDEQILSRLPPHLAGGTFVSHDVDSSDFSRNMIAAQGLLDMYQSRARLIVTTLLRMRPSGHSHGDTGRHVLSNQQRGRPTFASRAVFHPPDAYSDLRSRQSGGGCTGTLNR